MPFVNDPTITNDERLLRRIPHWQWVEDGAGGLRPSSAAFSDENLSVDLASVLQASGQTPATTLSGHQGFALASVTAQVAREQGQAVCRDPLANNPAHAIVAGKKTTAVKRHLARHSEWVVPPPLLSQV